MATGQVHIVSIPVGDPGGDDALLLFQAPSDASGGGISIVEAKAVNMAATTGGTSFTYQLLKYSNAGTPAVNGTITDSIGGSADEWGDSIPKSFAISSAFVDAGEWVALDYAEENSQNPTNSFITIKYLMGK